jgi:Zn-dependent protease
MDEMTLLFSVFAVIALWAGLFGTRLLVAWLQLMRMRFGPGDMLPADRAAMPVEVAAILDPMAGRLAALGFAYEETVLAQPMLRYADAQPVWIDVYVHAQSGSRASVQIAESPEPGHIAAVSFVTDFEQSMLETVNRKLHLLLPAPAACQLADAAVTTLAEHWAFHCRRVAEADAGSVISDLATVRERHRTLRAGIFEHCQNSGWMRAEGEESRFTAGGAWRYLRQVMAGNRRVAALPPSEGVEDASLRVLADAYAWRIQEALTQQNVMSRRGKVLWFTVSAAAGAVAFGYMTSWEMVPAILGVLLFHEFGHALAMRAVGYRGLSVLVLPFLGAVAIGRKDDAGPWQKLAVLMAGPLPGLVLAVVCLRLSVSLNDPELRSVLTTVGWMALSINLFNLLPFTPLDGGQIVDTFLFSRRPRFRFGFFVASTGALAAVAFALSSIPLAAAALLLAFGIPGGWRRMRLLKDMNALAPGETAVNVLFQRVHAAPGPRWPAFAQRAQTVRALLPWLNGRAPTWVESLFGIGIYLAAIALPIPLLWDTGLPQQALFSLSQSGADVAPPDWAKQLAEATTPEERWKVLWAAGQWFEEAEDETQALQYFQLALTEAAQLPEDSQKALRVIDARLAVARYSEPDVTRPAYVELMPTLRELPPTERWRLADVLEAMNWLDSKATPATRIERYREAVATRELDAGKNSFSLLHDRVQLARLIDTQGDADGAEALLRENLAYLSSKQRETAAWEIEPVAWFLIAHERAAEAETLVAAQTLPSVPTYGNETLRSTLAWAQLVQGKTASARKVLTATLEKMEKQRWNDSRRLMLLLDLIHASTDVPEEEAHWLNEATTLRAAMDPNYRGGRYLLNDDDKGWEGMRNQARLAAYKRLPGAEEELSEAARKVCRPTSTEDE